MSSTAESIWQGHRVRLRPVEPDDWAVFHAWGQDDHAARLSYVVTFPRSRAASRAWAERLATEEPTGDVFRWVIVADGDQVVGTINTHDCDRRAGAFSYGMAVAPDWRRQGFAAEAIRLVLRYFFAELGYQKVTIQVYEFNTASRRLHERLGFVREGTLRRMVYTGGRHWDVLVFGLTREEFEADQAGKLPDFTAPSA